jgi:bifunctional DNA-binding transcriptional regulator/antitoxin component of YhaV-PrlF toxin-antitoxin module
MMVKFVFLCQVQEQGRIAVPKLIYDFMKLKKGDILAVRIERQPE